MSVAVVTDSTSDLDPALAERLGIDVVPLFVNFGDTRYRDVVELSHDEFYRLLATRRQLPTTSQPTSAMFEDAFRPNVETGRPIVCLTIMQSISGTINAAKAAATQFPGAEIHLIDSSSVTAGLALQCIHVVNLDRGGAGVPEILTALERDRNLLNGFATVPDLSHAVRTGRVSRAQAFIGSLVKIVPILRLDHGSVGEAARVRTFARAQDTMIESTLAAIGSGEGAYIGIVHTRALPVAKALREKLAAGLTGTPACFELMECGSAIATHAGPGAVGIFSIPG